MKIITTAQAKTAVSALRRELKVLGKAPEALSHNDCLTLMAKAMGFPSWNAWEASLSSPDAGSGSATPGPQSGEVELKYPLVNRGEFDFIEPDEDGTPFAGDFSELEGTSETILATGVVTSATRNSADAEDSPGGVRIESDSSETHWDTSETITHNGFEVWVDKEGQDRSGAQMILAPLDSSKLYSSRRLPVRPKLVQAFREYFTEQKVEEPLTRAHLISAAKVIGFALTKKEEAELLDKPAA